jgi:4-hydroxy-tetrahydrodipicolinate synthase
VPGIFLAQRGCHGALLLGTTGEGPSFSPKERVAIWQTSLRIRQSYPDFLLLAGSGTPSLEETIELNHSAFHLGLDGVVTLPPYYFRKVSDEGLFDWFSLVIERSVPVGKLILGYHFPGVSGVALSIELLARLKEKYPAQFAGIKDSSGDADFTRQLGERFGSALRVFTGNDRLFSLALDNHAAGCITALANISSPALRQLWEYHRKQDLTGRSEAQKSLDLQRAVAERYLPAPALYKMLLHRRFSLPYWQVRPPLQNLSPDDVDNSLAEFSGLPSFASV